MTCNQAQLVALLEAEDLQYYLIPNREGVMLTFTGSGHLFQFKIYIELDQRFVQFKSVNFLACPMDHPNLLTTLKVLGEANFRLRLMKFGWDPTDGEIAAYADIWLMDAEFTEEQFGRSIRAYMSILDDEYPKFKAAIDAGTSSGGAGDEGDDDSTIDAI